MPSILELDLAKMAFFEKFKAYSEYDTLMMKYKMMSYNNSDDYGAEIDWTNLAISMMYYKIINMSSEEKKALLKGIREHRLQVKWEDLTKDVKSSELDLDFIHNFYEFLNWNMLIANFLPEVPQEFIELADEENLIDWNAVSAIPNLSKDFLERNIDKINWKIYLNTHLLQNVPVELWQREQFILAVRQNPDLISLRNDREAIAEINARLRKYVWIDRVSGVEGHYQDDTGLWIDTLRGAAADDADNLESDLEHTQYDAFFDENLKEQHQTKDEQECELEL